MLKAEWNISLDTECPFCHDDFDVLILTDAGDILKGMRVGGSGDLLNITCPSCEGEFEIETVY